MIVIATYNGFEFLPRLLNSIELFGSSNHKICIVDTGSNDIKSINYINSLDTDKYIIHRQNGGYDTGAYLYAYNAYKSYESEYIFMHDSIEVLTSEWIDNFKLFNTDVCYYAAFHMFFDSNEQVEWLCKTSIYNHSTPFGVFGPIFYIKSHILNLISTRFNLNNIIPTNKQEQQHMERGWAMMIDAVTKSVSWLSIFHGSVDNPMILYPNLAKFRPIRK